MIKNKTQLEAEWEKYRSSAFSFNQDEDMKILEEQKNQFHFLKLKISFSKQTKIEEKINKRTC